jgi:hypothetical protein
MRAAAQTYPGRVLDLSSVDLEKVANALADQTDFEHHWLINPDTGLADNTLIDDGCADRFLSGHPDPTLP